MRTKSGMGSDVDPIRMLLVVGILGGAAEVFSGHKYAVVVAIVCALALAWWVTRNYYLDRIDRIAPLTDDMDA